MMVDRHFLTLATAQSLQVAALAAVVALAVRAFARNRPHLAHALWLIVLVKCLTPPVWSSPAGVFCWLQPRPMDTPSESATEPWPTLDESTTMPFNEPSDNHTAMMFAADSADVAIVENDDRGDSSAAIPATFVDDESRTFAAITPPLHDSARATARWLAATWLVGSLTMIAVALLRGWKCWRLFRGSRTLIHPRLDRRVRVLCRQLGVRQAVRLLITESRVGPAVVGLLRPTILLPAAIVQGRKASELEPILAHELIHVRRGDLWVGLLQSLAQAVWWFHPLVWFAGRKIAREAERCCDEEVIAALACPPARYARSLLDVLELKQKLTAVPVFPGVRPVEVTSQRLERIMTLGQGCRRRTPWWCWAVMLLVAALTLPGAALVVGADEAIVPLPDFDGAENSRTQDTDSEIKTNATTEFRYGLTQGLAIVAKDLDLSGDAAKQFLLKHLCTTIAVKNADQPPGTWTGDTLVLHATQDNHQRIQNELARMRRYGCKLVEFQVYFAWGASAEIEKIANRWTLLPTTVPREESPVNGAPVPIASLPILVDAGDPPTNKASFVVEKKLPVMVELMNNDRVVEVLDRFQRHPRISLMQAPRMTLSTGRTGEVFDCTQRPFVVGLQEGQPQIRVVREGRALRVLPILQGDTVRLDYELTQSTIRGVEEMTIPAHDGQDAITLQVPEVAKSRVESSIDLPPGRSLLVGGLSTTNKKGEKESVLMLLKARPIVPKGTAAKVEPDTPRQLVGVGVNSDAGLTGEIAPKVMKANPIYHVVYDVSDLVKAKQYWCGTCAQSLSKKGPDFESLVAVIMKTIRPAAWDKHGGLGTIQPHVNNLSLVVGQTDQVHAEIVELLKRLRRTNKMEQRLTTPVALKFKDEPLSRVMEHLGKTAQVTMTMDPKGLADEGATQDSPVTVELSDAISVKSALHLILEPLHLCFVVRDEAVKITSAQRRDFEAYHVVYNVADLVSANPREVGIDFKRLVGAIKSTIQLGSWDDLLGTGTIERYSNNRLVIQQTRQSHEQIEELLEQLRRLRDVKVSLQIEAVPAKAIDERLKREVGLDAKQHHKLLSPHETNGLLEDGAIPGRRLTIYNGQLMPMRLSELRSGPNVGTYPWQSTIADLAGLLTLQAVASPDRSTVRLTVNSARPPDERTMKPRIIVETIPDGRSLLIDLAEPNSTGAASEPRYILITPRVIAREKEEKEEAAAEQKGEITNFSFLLAR